MPNSPCLLFVFGTRPECIKLAPLILEAQNNSLSVVTCFTGQHKEMATPILDYFKIKIDYNLDIMQPGQSLNQISSSLFEKLPPVLLSAAFDYVVVQGDTTTAAMTALMAFQCQIPVVHIEAGLRTYNLTSPWPEEMNRRMISLMAQLHFVPTAAAHHNLLNEGIKKENLFMVGNTGIDALRLVVEKLPPKKPRNNESDETLLLVTLHRRENFGPEMQSIMSGIKVICENHPKVKVLWPLHQNPKVKTDFDAIFTTIPKNISIVQPMNYFDFVQAMNDADIIITDSGGVQEEAPFLGKPILICRQNTERPETVDCGSGKLIGTSKAKLISEVEFILGDLKQYDYMAQKRTPFGDGFASQKIIQVLLERHYIKKKPKIHV